MSYHCQTVYDAMLLERCFLLHTLYKLLCHSIIISFYMRMVSLHNYYIYIGLIVLLHSIRL